MRDTRPYDDVDEVIRQALITQIKVLTERLEKVKAESAGHERRADALETALNNVMLSLPDNVQAHYHPVLEANRKVRR